MNPIFFFLEKVSLTENLTMPCVNHSNSIMQPFVVSAGYELLITLSPLFEGQSAEKYSTATNSQVNRIIQTPDNKIAFTTNSYVHICDMSVSQQKPQQYSGHQTNVTDICFLRSNANIFYTCSEDRKWHMWDVRSGQRSNKKVTTSSSLNSLAITNDEKVLYTANEKGHVEMWDIASTKMLAAIRLSQLPVRSIGLAPDNERIVAACQDGNVVIIGVEENQLKELHRFKGHTDVLIHTAIAPDQKTFVTTAGDSTAKLWDFETYELKFTLAEQNQKKWVWDACYTRDSNYIVTGGTDKILRTWETQTGKLVYKNENSHSKGITALTIFQPFNLDAP